MENAEMTQAKQRLEKACNMFSVAVSHIDVDIAIAEQVAAELILRKIIGEMKEAEKK
jgi:hypothetical protein